MDVPLIHQPSLVEQVEQDSLSGSIWSRSICF
jgi:hypothetical protein